MRAYTYQIGDGSLEELKHVAFSDEVLGDSLGEAVVKAKAMTRKRAAQPNETMVRLLDEAELVWARSVEGIDAD